MAYRSPKKKFETTSLKSNGSNGEGAQLMHVAHNLQDHLRASSTNTSPVNMNSFRTLLFICGPGTVSNAMVAAIESDFPWLSVKTVSDLRLALKEFDHPVQLVLVESGMASQLDDYWPEFTKIHTAARLAFLSGDDAEMVGPEHLGSVDPQIVRGLLGLNTNLDVFLSVLRLVLKGGTYFPPAGNRPEKRGWPEPQEPHNLSQYVPPEPARPAQSSIDKLTKREKEILVRIAMGNQNKIIAAALGLSEHTVKIHIHNIITKLGMHNRTEVVALYFEQKSREAASHARGTDNNEGDPPVKADD